MKNGKHMPNLFFMNIFSRQGPVHPVGENSAVQILYMRNGSQISHHFKEPLIISYSEWAFIIFWAAVSWKLLSKYSEVIATWFNWEQ